ncbi:helix-turn-helix domain-containing protein [Lentzea sp. NPDC005914]|uniref:winged helix-turn-helix transcriptional regulator n=1 Tax=Lentzea sp. NPDC005914 TaxID=3154572 RepID=UPI0033EDF411
MRENVEAKRRAPDRHSDLFHSDCPGRVIFDDITSRWAPLILVKLAESPLRFYELRDHIGGISEKVLSEKLRLLTRDGLVDRTVEPAIPPRVSYALTDTGHSLAKPLRQLMRWVADNGETVLATRTGHDDQPAS